MVRSVVFLGDLSCWSDGEGHFVVWPLEALQILSDIKAALNEPRALIPVLIPSDPVGMATQASGSRFVLV